ncbi:hypothetical protein DERP_009807 [Dermatophagoides pteronyssinus]|uniref:Uncharacterized protein n=1 Tax=Dermatophagoides pteronyssinus TaxID=6956 RepID=A0ABQ8IR90_DERPT|nr:hypothetical protein DERP_009807 [Dermatophagoides pteronyssinus]
MTIIIVGMSDVNKPDINQESRIVFAVNDHHQDDSNAEYLRRLVSHKSSTDATVCDTHVSHIIIIIMGNIQDENY